MHTCGAHFESEVNEVGAGVATVWLLLLNALISCSQVQIPGSAPPTGGGGADQDCEHHDITTPQQLQTHLCTAARGHMGAGVLQWGQLASGERLVFTRSLLLY